MTKKPATSVDAFLAELKHPLAAGMRELRAAIVASSSAITEHIKWNAPSFRHAGDDRVTFRIPPKGGFQLIFHRGVKRKEIGDFVFVDPSGLMEWAAPDRGVVAVKDLGELRAKQTALVALVNAWMQATATP